MDRFSNLPNDVIINIALELDLPEIISLCRTSRRFNRLVCENRNFWIRRLKNDFDIDYLSIGTGDPKIYYEFFNQYTNIHQQTSHAIENGYKDIVNYLFEQEGIKYVDINGLLYFAARGGDVGLVNLIIEKGANNWDRGLQGASRGGHINLVDFFIEKGGDVNRGLASAAYNNQIEIIDHLIKLGADDWNSALRGAAYNGNKELVEFFVDKGANNWDRGLFGAIGGSNKELINYFIEKGANNWRRAFRVTMLTSHDIDTDLMNFFIEKAGDSMTMIDWNLALANAAVSGRKDLVEFMIEKGANDWDRGLRGAIIYFRKSKDPSLIHFFVEKGADLNNGLEDAARIGSVELIDYLIQRGADDWERGLKGALLHGDKRVVKFFRDKIKETK